MANNDDKSSEEHCISVKTDRLIMINRWESCSIWVERFSKYDFELTDIKIGFSGWNIYDPGVMVMRK